MKRQPIQVLVIPFRKQESSYQFGVFKRSDTNYWQFIAGGVDGVESPLQAAIRESSEEAGITKANFIALDSTCSMPANIFKDWKQWPKGTYVVKEYSFAAEVINENIILSGEHSEYKWCSYDEACSLLKWDSNKTALWELFQRLND